MLYNLVLWKNISRANYQLAHLPEEIGKQWNEVFSDESNKKFGVEWVVYCDCTWSSEEYRIWAVNSYKDIPARMANTKEIEKAAWYQYADLFTMLGTTDGDEKPILPTFPHPIYQLYMIRSNPAAAANLAALGEEGIQKFWKQVGESAVRLGGVYVLHCNSYWANEDYDSFGIVAWPNVEARQAHAKDLQNLGFSRYVNAFTILGTPRE
jgi:hypothetical protein